MQARFSIDAATAVRPARVTLHSSFHHGSPMFDLCLGALENLLSTSKHEASNSATIILELDIHIWLSLRC